MSKQKFIYTDKDLAGITFNIKNSDERSAQRSADAATLISKSVSAADASLDAAQALLAQIMNDDPVAAQAYYLICAADLALDPAGSRARSAAQIR